MYLADQSGGFARQGLRVDLLPGGPGLPGVAAALRAGDADLGIASDLLAVLESVQVDPRLVILGATMGVSPLGIARPADAGPVTMESLVGCRIGAGTEGDRAVLNALFRVAGLAPDFQFKTIGHDVAELLTGDIDAMCCSTINQPLAAARRGIVLETATFDELGLPMPADVIVATRGLVETARDSVIGFLYAMREGWSANAADPSGGARLAADRYGERYGYDVDDAEEQNVRQMPFVLHAPRDDQPLLWIDIPAMRDSLDALAAAGLGPFPDPAEFVDLSLLTEALNTRVAQ